MKMKGKIRLFFAILFGNVFLGGVCVSAMRQQGELSAVWAENGSCELSGDEVESGSWELSGTGMESGSRELSETGIEAGEKILALTFDDGPHKRYTEKLLDGLKERSIRASFFLMGESIPGNEALVRRMAEEGHFIGVHCYSHVDLTRKTTEESCEDILRTAALIEEITGVRPEYIRPPYGNWSAELEECVEMLPVFWDIDTRDWESQDRNKILHHICKNAGKHHIILLHDVFEASVDAALAAVDTLTNEGYTFVTVNELLID